MWKNQKWFLKHIRLNTFFSRQENHLKTRLKGQNRDLTLHLKPFTLVSCHLPLAKNLQVHFYENLHVTKLKKIMASGLGFILDANNRMVNNRALLNRAGSFNIRSANKFIQPSGRKYTFKKLSVLGSQKIRTEIQKERLEERKRTLLLITASTAASLLIFWGVFEFMNYIF